MKRKFYGLMMLLAGMTFTACSDNDDKASNGDPDFIYNFVEPEVDPIADETTVKISGKTYVFDGNYVGGGKALVSRATNRAELLNGEAPNEEVQNIILHNDKIGQLTNSELVAIIIVLAKNGSIVIADPTVDKLKELMQSLRSVIALYQEGGNNVAAQHVISLLNTDVINRIVMWTNDFDFSVYLDEEGKGDYMSLLVLRELDSYIAFDVEEEMTDYHYGLKADRAAEWINTQETEEEAAASRMAAARAMAARAGGEAEQYVDKMSKSWDHTYNVGRQITGPQGYSKYHNCTLTIRVWTAYSKEKNCDVYCVTQSITAYNQNLKCGPSDEYKWYDGENWQPWKDLEKSLKNDGITDLRKDVYGPYMSQLYTRCELQDPSKKPVKVEEYAPKNSTSGGSNVSDGFSFGLGASVSVESSGPKASVSGSMSWSHSVSRFNADLKMTASPSTDGVVEWTYKGTDPDSHFSFLPWKNHSHETAKDILKTTCTVEQAWVWTIADPKSNTVVIQPTIQLQDSWLTYDRCYKHIGEAYPHYLRFGDKTPYKKMVINTPPRFIQTWSMSVKTDAAGADVTKIRSYLSEQLNQYFLTSAKFYTRKGDHKKSYNESKKIEEYDEIGKFVFTSKDAFTHNNNVKDILREAGKIGGVPADGSYTIVWRQTDAGINSDSEEFTFSMK